MMDIKINSERGEVVKAWIEKSGLQPGDKLPSERDLAQFLGLSRGDLRQSMLLLETSGVVDRKVGRGTYLASRMGLHKYSFKLDNLLDTTSPHHAMMARLALEPELAGFAAIHGSQRDIDEARRLSKEMRAVSSWSQYEELDARFHEVIALASENPLLIEMHRIVNDVRVAVVWSKLKLPNGCPSPDYHSFDEHDDIVSSLETRDRKGAQLAMKKHLHSVHATFLSED